MKILVVEDNHINRFTLVGFLKDLGHETVESEHGLDAYERFKKEPFDCVITDLMMPVMNGLELIEKIRSNHQDQLTYIIVLTAYNDELHMDSSYEQGADDFLAKPFNKKELKQRLVIAERIISYIKQINQLKIDKK